MSKARQLAEAIASNLPKAIQAAALPAQSKIPFMALSLRELLLHRASALATPAISLLEAGNSVGAAVLTRSLMETVALMFELHRKIDEFLTKRDEQSFGKFLMDSAFANRYEDGGELAEHYTRSIMTPIDNVNKKMKGFRATYDALSEYAHPNWSGVLGSFGTIDHEKYAIQFGSRIGGKALEIGAPALAATLDILTVYYNMMPESLLALNRHFEKDWGESDEG